MRFKCPDCGASLTDDSRFCKYCGAKIDDGVKRVEVKIDKRIEDVAEIKRASYEEQESLLRQKKLKHEYRAGKAKRVLLLSLLICSLGFLIPLYIINPKYDANQEWLVIFGVVAMVAAPVSAITIIVQLIKGKW